MPLTGRRGNPSDAPAWSFQSAGETDVKQPGESTGQFQEGASKRTWGAASGPEGASGSHRRPVLKDQRCEPAEGSRG